MAPSPNGCGAFGSVVGRARPATPITSVGIDSHERTTIQAGRGFR